MDESVGGVKAPDKVPRSALCIFSLINHQTKRALSNGNLQYFLASGKVKIVRDVMEVFSFSLLAKERPG